MNDTILELLTQLHDEADRLARQLSRTHRSRLQCARGCCDCCIDEIRVFEIEAERIRLHAGDLLAAGAPHARGRCAFLSEEGACRIYEVRPYVCRTQGLPLRWISESEDGSLVERRDICPMNENGEPIEEIVRRDCWTIGPFEDRLSALQSSTDGGRGRRVRLRDLFARQA